MTKKPKTPTQKYREKMKKAGFVYVCFWLHEDDVPRIKDIIAVNNLNREIEQIKKGEK